MFATFLIAVLTYVDNKKK
ncbi:putative holin-like toxin [Paenibacillus sp. 37]